MKKWFTKVITNFIIILKKKLLFNRKQLVKIDIIIIINLNILKLIIRILIINALNIINTSEQNKSN